MANIVELHEMSDEKLEEMLENALEEMFNLRFQMAAKRLTDTSRARKVRREVAQVRTVLNLRAKAVEAAAGHAAIAPVLRGKEWTAQARYQYEDGVWAVRFNDAGGKEIASAQVDLDKKRPAGRRARALGQPQLVKSFALK